MNYYAVSHAEQNGAGPSVVPCGYVPYQEIAMQRASQPGYSQAQPSSLLPQPTRFIDWKEQLLMFHRQISDLQAKCTTLEFQNAMLGYECSALEAQNHSLRQQLHDTGAEERPRKVPKTTSCGQPMTASAQVPNVAFSGVARNVTGLPTLLPKLPSGMAEEQSRQFHDAIESGPLTASAQVPNVAFPGVATNVTGLPSSELPCEQEAIEYERMEAMRYFIAMQKKLAQMYNPANIKKLTIEAFKMIFPGRCTSKRKSEKNSRTISWVKCRNQGCSASFEFEFKVHAERNLLVKVTCDKHGNTCEKLTVLYERQFNCSFFDDWKQQCEIAAQKSRKRKIVFPQSADGGFDFLSHNFLKLFSADFAALT